MDEAGWQDTPPRAVPTAATPHAVVHSSVAGRSTGAPAPGAPSSSSGRSRKALPLAVGGIAIVIVALAGAAVLWFSAEGRHDDTIEGFARAPAGCDTTLAFESDGRFVIYVETAGTVERLDGDCGVVGPFDRGASVAPAFELVIVGVDGEELAVGAHSGIAYDSDGYVGSSIGAVQIDGPGEYLVRVASPAEDFVVAVGIDPDDDAGVLRLGAISLLVSGLVVGGTALVLAARQRHEPAMVTAVWTRPIEASGPRLEPPSDSSVIPGEALRSPPSAASSADASPWAAPPRDDG